MFPNNHQVVLPQSFPVAAALIRGSLIKPRSSWLLLTPLKKFDFNGFSGKHNLIPTKTLSLKIQPNSSQVIRRTQTRSLFVGLLPALLRSRPDPAHPKDDPQRFGQSALGQTRSATFAKWGKWGQTRPNKWVWVKIKPPGESKFIHVSIYQGFIWGTYF